MMGFLSPFIPGIELLLKSVLLCHKDGRLPMARKGSVHAFKVEFWIEVSKNMTGYYFRIKVP